MLIHCVDEGIELSPDQAAEVEASTSAWIEQTIRDGVAVHGAYLEPVCEARTVRLCASEVLVADGPFAETKEQIGGYDVIECADLDEAIAVASRHPVAGSARSKCGRFSSARMTCEPGRSAAPCPGFAGRGPKAEPGTDAGPTAERSGAALVSVKNTDEADRDGGDEAA
jgi:hypothetical protein